jgi:hypothetical protein
MNSSCGCRDAEQCWRHCCCHTLAERLEWARENHVQPPDYVLVEAKAQGIEWQSPSDDDCCAEHGKTCCCHTNSPMANDEDHEGNQLPGDGQPRERERAPAPGVVLIKALQCQGIGSNWLASITSLPPPPAVRWVMAWNPLGPVSVASRFSSSLSSEPPNPPPRVRAI